MPKAQPPEQALMSYEPLDTSDIDRWIGQPIGGEQLVEPVTVTDVRRWVQAMHNPNPAHYDGEIVMPQSMLLACSVRHGVFTANQGRIPGGGQMNAGEEWWFGPRLAVGDKVTLARQALDYRVTQTAQFGPTVFQRGDTTFTNQHGQVLGRQRATATRFVSANVRKGGGSSKKASADPPEFSADEIAAFEAERLAYARGLREHTPPTLSDLTIGAELPRRLIGPHSIASFAAEYRAFLHTIWGNLYDDGLPRSPRVIREAEAAIDPEFGDSLYHGAGAGHVDSKAAALRGIPRAYNAGATTCAWIVDYAANWAGEAGEVRHVSLQYRSPVLVGDVTYISAKVTALAPDEQPGFDLVTLEVTAVDQNGKTNTRGTATVRLRT